MTDTKELRRLAEAAPKGTWEVQTSNSWRRIGTKGRADGDILRPTNHPIDKHPDLAASTDTLDYIAAASPSAVLALLDEVEALKTICAEAYQVVGVLASDAGRFDDDAVIKCLDNLSAQEMQHTDVLPFPSASPQPEKEEG